MSQKVMGEPVTISVTANISVLGGANKHLVQTDGENLQEGAAVSEQRPWLLASTKLLFARIFCFSERPKMYKTSRRGG